MLAMLARRAGKTGRKIEQTGWNFNILQFPHEEGESMSKI
jgi:hypothetical protein